jgi:hypothetical protein
LRIGTFTGAGYIQIGFVKVGFCVEVMQRLRKQASKQASKQAKLRREKIAAAFRFGGEKCPHHFLSLVIAISIFHEALPSWPWPIP